MNGSKTGEKSKNKHQVFMFLVAVCNSNKSHQSSLSNKPFVTTFRFCFLSETNPFATRGFLILFLLRFHYIILNSFIHLPDKVLGNAEDKDATQNVEGVTKRQGCHQMVEDIFLFQEPNHHQKVSDQTNQPNYDLNLIGLKS